MCSQKDNRVLGEQSVRPRTCDNECPWQLEARAVWPRRHSPGALGVGGESVGTPSHLSEKEGFLGDRSSRDHADMVEGAFQVSYS